MATIDTLPRAYQTAAREIRFPYLYGTPVARRSIAQLELVGSWRDAHPESKRRHLAFWTWLHHTHGVTYGMGQMARDYQRALEQNRQYPNQFSHPDRSWHVATPRIGFLPVACDNVGTGNAGNPPDRFNALHAYCGQFGLRTVSGSTERHHTQLAGLPGSKDTWLNDPNRAAIVTFNDWPRLPDRFYPADDALPAVDWDPANHRYWLFPLDTNKPELAEGAVDAGTPGHVRYAQHALNVAAVLHSNGAMSCGIPDGKFGPRTAGAVRALQADQGLTADGKVGPWTWANLDAHIHGAVVLSGQG